MIPLFFQQCSKNNGCALLTTAAGATFGGGATGAVAVATTGGAFGGEAVALGGGVAFGGEVTA